MAGAAHNLGQLRTHMFDTDATGPVFSRDCCEYHFDTPGGTRLVVLANHFKSEACSSPWDPMAAKRRRRQAEAVAGIYRGLRAQGIEYVAITGDLNDNPASTALRPLTGLADLTERGVAVMQGSRSWPVIVGVADTRRSRADRGQASLVALGFADMGPSPEFPSGQPAGSATAELADADYLARLGDELHRAIGGGVATFTELLRAGKGATPDVISDLLRSSYYPDTIPTAILRSDESAEDPELHPLLFEWYFNQASSQFIAEVAIGAGQEVLCLGTPSVASDLTRASSRPDVTLVDADESVAIRFPSLASARVHVGELGSFSLTKSYSVVIADPPWYFSDTMRWINLASQAVREGGTIVMPLFPELTRPSASAERTAILDEARRIGTVELWGGRIIYKTPGFEKHALAALGMGETGDWRSGDLLVIRRVASATNWRPDSRVHRGLEGWRRFRIGPQIVMLRDIETTSQSPATFLPIAGCPRNTLTSVSERDPRRNLVGIWTSRNRVAAVGNVSEAARLLEFAAGDSHEIPRHSSSAWTFLQNLLLTR